MTTTPYLLAVQMDVQPDHAADFHRVYDTEHIPNLLAVPGVLSVKRFRRLDVLRIALAGSVRELTFPTEPEFTAFYELEDPEVLITAAWRNAVELGAWPTQVRPFTGNRKHVLHQRIFPKA